MAVSRNFNSRMVCFSPSSMGMVSLPTIRSPCMSRMSKNAVLTNTMPADHANTGTMLRSNFPNTDRGANMAVTIPHAIVIRMVFDPGTSLILLYLPLLRCSGISFKLYESPIKLIARRIRNGSSPMVYAFIRPAAPAISASAASSILCLL